MSEQFEEVTTLDMYRSIYRYRGFLYSVKHFFNSHLFDILNGTDTHIIVPCSDFNTQPDNFVHGKEYQASWSKELSRSFKAAKAILGPDFKDYSFIDLGCGKGKAVLLWKQLCRKFNIQQNIIGIDYYGPFIEAANLNHDKIFGGTGPFFERDACDFDYEKYRDGIIIYLFNPFDLPVLESVLIKIRKIKHIIVYGYPVHKELLLRCGYDCLYSHDGAFNIEKTMIFARNRI